MRTSPAGSAHFLQRAFQAPVVLRASRDRCFLLPEKPLARRAGSPRCMRQGRLRARMEGPVLSEVWDDVPGNRPHQWQHSEVKKDAW